MQKIYDCILNIMNYILLFDKATIYNLCKLVELVFNLHIIFSYFIPMIK